MKKKILTVEDLVAFCKNQNFNHFSSKETGYQICVPIPATFEKVEDNETDVLMASVLAFHTGKNLNRSSVTEEAAKKAMKKMAYKPVLANFCEIDGVRDFTSHDFEIDDDGNYIYYEKQVGCFTSDMPYMEDDPDTEGRKNIFAKVAIPRQYTDAADIIERKGGTSVSIELAINEMAWLVSEDCLILKDVDVLALTLLGKDPATGRDVMPGMAKAHLQIEDFSAENNSIINKAQLKEEIITEIMSQLNNDKKADFSAENSKEGGKPKDMDKFNELLAKYNKTAEEITFEYENMTDEELVAAFAEAFDEDDPSSKEGVADEGTGTPEVVDDFAGDDQTGDDNPTDDDPADDEEDHDEEDHQSTFAIEDEDSTGTTKKFQKVFEVSHEDVRAALYALLAPYEENDNEWYWISAVYDNHFVYEGWDENHIFDQKYTKDGDIISFDGERTTLHRELLTDSEYAALNEMRSNYSAIETELNSYKSKELHSQREAVLASEDYSVMSDFAEFKELKEHMDDYSVEELTNKADLIYAKFMKSTFAAKSPAKKTGLVFMTSGKNEEEERLPYGGLFKNFKAKK